MTYRLRIFLGKAFIKFVRKERMSTRRLWQVFEDLHNGNIDVDYGGGVIKQRIARSAEGKSGGYRAVIYYRKGDKTFFMHGFSKKDKENLELIIQIGLKLKEDVKVHFQKLASYQKIA